jgi:pimeloyl-ACP methyl ester carboxylesterase
MLSGAELHVIAGAGHMAPTEQPGEFARIVRRFIET